MFFGGRISFPESVVVYVIIAVLLIAGSTALLAQSPTVAIGVGYERGDGLLKFVKPDSLRYNNIFENSIDLVSGFIELSLPISSKPDALLAARLSWSNAHGRLTAPLPSVLVLIRDPGLVIGGDQYEQVEFSMQSVVLELLGRIEVVKHLQLSAGPVVGYRAVSDYRMTQHIDTSLLAQFPPPYHIDEDGVIDDGRNLQEDHLVLGAAVTVGYELPLWHRLSLVPELCLRGDFTSPFPDSKWRVLSAGGTLALRYSL